MIIKKLKNKSWLSALTVVPNFSSTLFDLLFASLFVNILGLALPIFLMQVYDRIISNAAWDTLIWFVVGCLIAILLETLLRYVRSLAGNWQAAKFDHLASCDIIQTILSADTDKFKENPPGYYLDRINSLSTLKSIYGGPIFQTLMDIPFAALFFTGIWFLGRELVYIPLIIIGLFLITILIVRVIFMRKREEQIELNDRRLNFLLEALSGIYTVKSLALEEQMLRRYESIHEKTSDNYLQIGFWSRLPIALGAFFTQAAMFGVIILGAKEVINDQMTFGSLAACTMLVGRGMQPILSVANFLMQFSDGKVALNKVSEIAELYNEIQELSTELPKDITGAVEINNLTFGYSWDKILFRDININLTPGQFCFVSGVNGSGRSSLLQLIYGIHTPLKGRVLIDGFNISDCKREHMRGRIEYLSTEGVLFQGTIIDNVTLFNNTYLSAALSACSLVGLDDLVSKLPKGYETLINSKSNNSLPKGLVQRICIARALVKRPRVLLLDKTYLAMDTSTSSMFFDLIYNLKGTCTIIMNGDDPLFEALADVTVNLAEEKNG